MVGISKPVKPWRVSVSPRQHDRRVMGELTFYERTGSALAGCALSDFEQSRDHDMKHAPTSSPKVTGNKRSCNKSVSSPIAQHVKERRVHDAFVLCGQRPPVASCFAGHGVGH